MQQNNNDFGLLKKIEYLTGGFLTVFLASWIIYFCTEFLERILWSQAIVSQDEKAVAYEPVIYIFWKIVHFLNGPVMAPIINLALIFLIGIGIISSLGTKREKLYFGIPFSIAYIVNILVGILGGYFKNI